MHCANFELEGGQKEGDVLVAIAAMVTEGRIPGKVNPKSKGFHEGPHCPTSKTASEHQCNADDNLCKKYIGYRNKILSLWQRGIPLCVEVLLVATCSCEDKDSNSESNSNPNNSLLLEQWCLNLSHRRPKDAVTFSTSQLINAIRSQLHFSQISAWLSTDDKTSRKVQTRNLQYRISIPGETFEASKFTASAVKHQFPLTDIGNGFIISVTFLSLPRTPTIPIVNCANCSIVQLKPNALEDDVWDDRMHIMCTLKGKHCCEDVEESFNNKRNTNAGSSLWKNSGPSTSHHPKPKLNLLNAKVKGSGGSSLKKDNDKYFVSSSRSNSEEIVQQNIINHSFTKSDLNKQKDKGQILLDAIIRSGQKNVSKSSSDTEHRAADVKGREPLESANEKCESDSNVSTCDNLCESDISSIKNKSKIEIYIDNKCDSYSIPKYKKLRDVSNLTIIRGQARQKLTFDDFDDKDSINNVGIEIPSASEQAKFRKNLDSAASMVFHSRTGLPLTSSPAPVRRGKSCFDFDSSINSVSAIKSALFSSSFSTDDDSESDGSVVSPCSPETYCPPSTELLPVKCQRRGHANNLLGSFEESVLNGRLEPVSTVHGFRAELGASGSFVPKHLVVPVTVFFYTLGDNDKVCSPYLAHINLGKKGYNVPKSGTVQVTLFNPLGTVVKMFVIMYNLTDMPPNSQTFIRQRTLYMPINCKDDNLEWGPKWLRFLIHLRFMSSKSGRIYLHSDIRMIIFRKSDLDTATAHGIDMSYELRSFTHMPSNPRFSPRK